MKGKQYRRLSPILRVILACVKTGCHTPHNGSQTQQLMSIDSQHLNGDQKVALKC